MVQLQACYANGLPKIATHYIFAEKSHKNSYRKTLGSQELIGVIENHVIEHQQIFSMNARNLDHIILFPTSCTKSKRNDIIVDRLVTFHIHATQVLFAIVVIGLAILLKAAPFGLRNQTEKNQPDKLQIKKNKTPVIKLAQKLVNLYYLKALPRCRDTGK